MDTELRCLDANEAFAALYGCPAGDLLGRSLAELDEELARALAPHVPRGAGTGAPLVVVCVPPWPTAGGDGPTTGEGADEASQTRLECLLVDVSSRFLTAVGDGLEDLVSRSLAEIGQTFGLDRIALYQLQGGRLRLTDCWTSDGTSRSSLVECRTVEAPWLWAQARAGRVIALASLDDVPAEASADRVAIAAEWLGSHLLAPMMVGDQPIGLLVFGASHPDWEWTEAVQRRLGLLSGIIAGGLARRAGDADLRQRLRFEEVVADVATAFACTSPAELDLAIGRMLEHLCQVLGCDRATLSEFTGDEGALDSRWYYSAPGAPDTPVEERDTAPFMWYNSMLRRGEIIALVDPMDELPADAVAERRYMQRFGVQAHLAIPLVVRGKTIGFLQFQAIRTRARWSDDLLQRVKAVGELVGNALDRLRSDASARDLRDQLAHVARVATAGELAAAMAHELNQPLTAILSNAQAGERFIADGDCDEPIIREILADIATDANRAGETIRRLRSLLRGGATAAQAVDMPEVVGEVAHFVANEARLRQIEIRTTIADDVPPVKGDRAQLQQVLLNLVINAFEAMEQTDRALRQLTITCARDGEEVVIAFDDHGCGLAPDRADSVFEAFTTTKQSGMGLGLSICRTIATAHGGSVRCVPREGPGARFELRLPWRAPEP